MIDAINVWRHRWPAAAEELDRVLNPHTTLPACTSSSPSHRLSGESATSRYIRAELAKLGVYSWRNNVGATPSEIECPACRHRWAQVPTRYGLANESRGLNENFKSHDLILAIPMVITPEMVGHTVARFGSLEVKRPGWTFTGQGRERGQANWGNLVNRLGGFAEFTSGEDLPALALRGCGKSPAQIPLPPLKGRRRGR